MFEVIESMRVEILRSGERRRHWSPDERTRIVAETLTAGAKVFRRACVAGDRPYRHEERLWKPHSSRAGDVETRSLWRRPFYFSRTTRRPHKNRLARWTRGVSVHEKIGMGAGHLAFHRRWRCDDQHRSDGLSSRRNRLENAAKNLASASGRIKLWFFDSLRGSDAIFVREYG